MYHAPVLAEESQPLPEPGDSAAQPELVDAQLARLETRALADLRPIFSAAGIGASLLAAAAMAGELRPVQIALWLGAVVLAHLLIAKRDGRRGEAEAPRGRIGPAAEAAGLALLCASLPAWSFGLLPPADQLVAGGAALLVLASAIALAPVPVRAFAFTGAFTLAWAAALIGSSSGGILVLTTLAAFAAMVAAASARIGQWTSGWMKEVASETAEAENARMLLRQYEHRGAGWLWQVDAENRISYASPRLASLLGRMPAQLNGHSLPAILGGSGALGQALIARQPFGNFEMEIQSRQGPRWISLSADPIMDGAGSFQGFRGVGSDITDTRKAQQRLINLANMDVLTGLANRARLRQLLGEAIVNARASGGSCAFLFLDLDDFKPVNDTFGHPKGDRVLKDVARRLTDEVGPLGHVGRMGGDEFAVIVGAAGRAQVEDLAARIAAAIARPFPLDKGEVTIGVSIGCAFGPADGDGVDDLIQKADLALYQAKSAGRGTWRCFSAAMQNEAEDRQRLETDMRAGIDAGQFRLLYQPLIDASSQRLLGFEALIRWHHPIRGIVPPNDFIPLAEETGAILPLGEWVVKEACRAASQWPDVTVAVNVSARQLVSPAFPGAVRDALSRSKLPANRLELEVTESVFLGDTDGALEMLKRLRALGLGIALDDFGTGYSSLGYLNKAVFHKLKIDGSFVREAQTNKEAVAIIQSIVALARSFRMTVTAEGVETNEDYLRMRDLGCNQIQGYLFGKPMSFEDATALVRRNQKRASA